LSSVLHRLGLQPIYGKKGTLRRTLSVNPLARESAGDRVFPGDTIRLAVSDRSELSDNAIIFENGEVKFRETIADKDLAKRDRSPTGSPELQGVDLPDLSESGAKTPPAEILSDETAQSLVFEVSPLSGFSNLSGDDSSNGTSAKILSRSENG